jgi:hypothetical protein
VSAPTIDVGAVRVEVIDGEDADAMASSIAASLRPHLDGSGVEVDAVAEAVADQVALAMKGA